MMDVQIGVRGSSLHSSLPRSNSLQLLNSALSRSAETLRCYHILVAVAQPAQEPRDRGSHRSVLCHRQWAGGGRAAERGPVSRAWLAVFPGPWRDGPGSHKWPATPARVG